MWTYWCRIFGLSGKTQKNSGWLQQRSKSGLYLLWQCTVVCPVECYSRTRTYSASGRSYRRSRQNSDCADSSLRSGKYWRRIWCSVWNGLDRKMYTAYRLLGFDKILTWILEQILPLWLKRKNLLNVCRAEKASYVYGCPGWVKYLEYYHPEMIPHLTTARSPQMHSGGAYKTWWAEKEELIPRKLLSFLDACTQKPWSESRKNENRWYVPGWLFSHHAWTGGDAKNTTLIFQNWNQVKSITTEFIAERRLFTALQEE